MAKRRGNHEGTIFQDQRGYWVAEITLPSGKRKRKHSKLQKVVREWLLGQRGAVRTGAWTDSDSTTVSAFLDRYLADVAAHTLRPKTLEAYSYLVRMHIKPELGSIKLSALRPDHVQALYSAKLNSGLSRRTVQFVHSVLHKALDQALRWGLVGRNVGDLVDAPTPSKSAPVTWSLEQVRCFLAQVAGHRFGPIYVLGIACGLRMGELLGLHFEDIEGTRGRFACAMPSSSFRAGGWS